MSSNRDARNEISNFQKIVLRHWREEGRHQLPWRKTTDPYKILVSEIMLQQTHVDRVVQFYKKFLSTFPTVQSLARSDLASVLRLWSGLGYNRRAKMLHNSAKKVVREFAGALPKERAALESLPGVGPYTAGAIRAFAFNEPDAFIETNIRTVFIQHFFPRSRKISDFQLFPLIALSVKNQEPRAWYAALMDYGSYLKKQHLNPSRKSKHYAKQSKFNGSLRQVRGAILKAHLKKGFLGEVQKKFPAHFKKAFAALQAEKLIPNKTGKNIFGRQFLNKKKVSKISLF